MRDTTRCICGNVCDHTVGTVVHHPNGRDITIHNVPHYRCQQCDDVCYGTDASGLAECVVYAYRHDMDVIDFADWKETRYRV